MYNIYTVYNIVSYHGQENRIILLRDLESFFAGAIIYRILSLEILRLPRSERKSEERPPH